VVDVDLSILGQSEKRFSEYEQQIRQEYAWVPQAVFASKRAEILGRFLARPGIFATEWFRTKYEQQARATSKPRCQFETIGTMIYQCPPSLNRAHSRYPFLFENCKRVIAMNGFGFAVIFFGFVPVCSVFISYRKHAAGRPFASGKLKSIQQSDSFFPDFQRAPGCETSRGRMKKAGMPARIGVAVMLLLIYSAIYFVLRGVVTVRVWNRNVSLELGVVYFFMCLFVAAGFLLFKPASRAGRWSLYLCTAITAAATIMVLAIAVLPKGGHPSIASVLFALLGVANPGSGSPRACFTGGGFSRWREVFCFSGPA